MIDVSDIPKAELLKALHARAPVRGFGAVHAKEKEISLKRAESLTQNDTQYFDYLAGRVMKVEINGKELDPALYDRDAGEGAAQAVVDELRAKQNG